MAQMKAYSLDYGSMPSREFLLNSRFGPDMPQMDKSLWSQNGQRGNGAHLPFIFSSPLPSDAQISQSPGSFYTDNGFRDREWAPNAHTAHPGKLQTEPVRTEAADVFRRENLNYIENRSRELFLFQYCKFNK